MYIEEPGDAGQSRTVANAMKQDMMIGDSAIALHVRKLFRDDSSVHRREPWRFARP